MSFLTGLPIIGGEFDDSDRKAIGAVKNIRDLYDSIMLPELKDVDFNPEAMTYQLIDEDPMMLLAQMEALGQTQQLANDGLSSQDKLAMEMANQDAGVRAKQARMAAQQNAQARGVSGSGMEFAMGEIANQEAANRARSQGMEQASASAQQRAMNQMAYTQGLGNLRAQDTQTKTANAGVINNFNQMNTQNRNQANLRNIDTRNINAQQRFNNQMGVTDGKAAAQTGIANAYAAQNAARTDERNGNTEMLTNGMSYMAMSDINTKKDIRSADEAVREVFDNLSPYLWKYINPEHGEGEFVGVMAQDLEKSSAGKNAVVQTKEGKMVDFNKIIPMMLAAITSQQKRINELERSI